MAFEDETGFTLHPRLGRGWAKRGERLKVLTTSQHQKRLNLFGWVAPDLGRRGLVRSVNGDRRGFLGCLRDLYRRIQRKVIWLYVDNAAWHKGPLIRAFLRQYPRLRIVYLPPYQPGLNAQERLWRQLRYEATTNRYFENLDDIWSSIRITTRHWKQRKIQQLCHIT